MKPIHQLLARHLRNPIGWFGSIVGIGMNRSNRPFYDFIANHLQSTRPSSLLEIGFGNGQELKRLSQFSGSAYGIDHSQDMVDSAKRRLGKTAHVRLASSHDLPFDSEAFSVLVAVNVVYFWNDPAVDLSEFFRVLKPGGELIVGIRPYSWLIKAAFSRTGFQLKPDVEWLSLICSAGFVLIDSSTFENQVGEPAGHIWIFRKQA